jgi:ADP-heptose:LPS heptosyltransferase
MTTPEPPEGFGEPQGGAPMGREGFGEPQGGAPMGRRVLVARQDSVGDVLLAGPAVRAVAAGTERVTLLCGPRGRAAGALLPGVDQVVVAHAAWIDAAPRPVTRAEVDELVDRLVDLEVDQALVLTSFHQSPLPLALLLRMAGVPTIAAISVDYPGSLLDVRHRVDDDLHEVERGLSLAAALGYRLADGDDGRLAVRRDPPAPQRHAALVGALVAAGRRVVVTGDAGERRLTATVAGGRSGVVDLGGRVDLAGLAEVLAGAEVVVVGNTGPAHLAAAVGTPVVSLFSPVVPAVRWRPWGVPQVLLGDQLAACAGSRARVCPVPGHPCLDGVPVEGVVAAVDQLAAVRAVEGVTG